MFRRKNKQTDEYTAARKRVRAKKWFYRHFSAYAVTTLFFFLMNLADNIHDLWWIYPAISWGAAVLLHRLWVFGLPFSKAGTKEWEEREIAKELAKSSRALPLAAPAPSLALPAEEDVNIDDHLELKEVAAEREMAPNYQRDDLV